MITRAARTHVLAVASLAAMVAGSVASWAFADGDGLLKMWTCPAGYSGCTGVILFCASDKAACCCPNTPPTTPPTYNCACADEDCGDNGACVMGS